jgi:glucosamine--fructose-6-phosphate aminotransferase (isomerizing)
VGEFLFEQLARIPSEVEYASEFRYRNPNLEEGTIVIAISSPAKRRHISRGGTGQRTGATVLGAVNVVGSTIARMTDAGVYLRVGPKSVLPALRRLPHKWQFYPCWRLS